MRDNAVYAWVTNAPVANACYTRNIDVVRADHTQTLIHEPWTYK